MRPHLLTALLLCALPAQAQTQAQLEAGRSVDLRFNSRDLAFNTTDLKFAVVDMGGKILTRIKGYQSGGPSRFIQMMQGEE